MPERPSIRQLDDLVALAETLNFRRAAERCFVSQPALSAQIQKLEDIVGNKLFERDPRRVIITPAGAEATERAKAVLAATGSDVSTGAVMAWIGCVVLPLVVTAGAAMRWAGWVGSTRPGDGSAFAARTLILSTWLYLALNQVIFGVPWPWSAWNHRATSASVFVIGAIGLTLAVFRRARIAEAGGVERGGGTPDGSPPGATPMNGS